MLSPVRHLGVEEILPPKIRIYSIIKQNGMHEMTASAFFE
jgi:hypothetical protein